MKTLRRRPYQENCLVKIIRRFKDGVNRLLVVWPTGMGKTVLFAGLPETLQLALRLTSVKRHRMLVLVHREELIEQAVAAIKEWNPDLTVGIERGSDYAKDEQIVVASVPTLGREDSTRLFRFRIEEFGAIVVDEAHHCVGQTYQRVLEYFRVMEDKDILLLGVTATPNRSDGVGLGRTFIEIVDYITLIQAINEGWLVDLYGKRIRTGGSVEGVKRLSSDDEVARSIDTPVNNNFVARALVQEAAGLKTLLFCANVDHSINQAAALKRMHVEAEAIWGEDPQRKDKIKAHKRGDLQVLTNCNVLIEGYDDRDIECVALDRPTDSETLYTQMIGRGARLPSILKEYDVDNLLEALAAGYKIRKTKCLVLDFVYSTSKHSLVTLPSLLGLSGDMDMQGRSLTEVATEIERIKASKPKLDVATLTDASKLQAIAENVELLKVVYAPEVIEFSQNQWIKTGPSAYVLLLRNDQSLVVMYETSGRWLATGFVETTDVCQWHVTLKDAIKYADVQLRILGGVTAVSRVKREASWHDDPATPFLINLAEKNGIKVPPGATKGELSRKLTETFAKNEQAAQKRMQEALRRMRSR